MSAACKLHPFTSVGRILFMKPADTARPDDGPAQTFAAARRIIVKVGSAVLAPDGELDPGAITRLVDDLAAVLDQGREIVLVSSGAIAAGFRALGQSAPPRTIMDRQAAAAVGQMRLVAQYAGAFARHGRTVGQVLLSGDDIEDRRRAVNARHTLQALLRNGCVPIINENDSVSYEEIKIGDNDRLAALVAPLVDADLLIMLSVSDGLHEDGPNGALILEVRHPEEAAPHARESGDSIGVGGMRTKVAAAAIAGEFDVPTLVACGAEERIVQRLLAGEAQGTFFHPTRRLPARRHWIGHAARATGAIVLDEGAVRAIVQRGASLLPAGVAHVEGSFEAGDVVDVRGPDGQTHGRGVTAYSSDELVKIQRLSTDQIEATLGYKYCDEIIHRDDMWIRDDSKQHREGEAEDG